jgi:hypothetical protein
MSIPFLVLQFQDVVEVVVVVVVPRSLFWGKRVCTRGILYCCKIMRILLRQIL